VPGHRRHAFQVRCRTMGIDVEPATRPKPTASASTEAGPMQLANAESPSCEFITQPSRQRAEANEGRTIARSASFRTSLHVANCTLKMTQLRIDENAREWLLACQSRLTTIRAKLAKSPGRPQKTPSCCPRATFGETNAFAGFSKGRYVARAYGRLRDFFRTRRSPCNDLKQGRVRASIGDQGTTLWRQAR